MVTDAGLAEQIASDSAGTHAYHQGSPPDARALEAAARRGFELHDIRARPINAEDFERYDYILAMDLDNLEILRVQTTDSYREKVMLFLDFADMGPEAEVPDPYYGGASGFERVLDLVEEASRGLLETLRSRLDQI
jgi:protein-tyrosine phosphatase